MQENYLLTPANRQLIDKKILNAGLELPDFAWEEHKSEELLEKSKSDRNRLGAIANARRKAEYKFSYENALQPQVSKLVHTQTGAFFTFDRYEKKRMSKFSFGNEYGTDKKFFNEIKEQVEYATKWIDDLVENLKAQGFIDDSVIHLQGKENKDVEVVENNSTQKDIKTSDSLTDLEKAHILYEEIKAKLPLIKKNKNKTEQERQAKIFLAKIDDAIKLYGTEYHNEKVELGEYKNELESLVPASLDDFSKSIWRSFTKFNRKLGINPRLSFGCIFIIVIVVGFVAFYANCLKITQHESSSIYPKTDNPNLSVNSKNSNTVHTNISSLSLNTPSPTPSPVKKPETITVDKGETGKAFDGKILISVVLISDERTSSGEYVTKVTAEIGSPGKPSIKIIRKDVGYATELKVNDDTDEIRVMRINIIRAEFSVTRID